MERQGVSVWSPLPPAPTGTSPLTPKGKRGAERPNGPAPRLLFGTVQGDGRPIADAGSSASGSARRTRFRPAPFAA